MLEPTTFKFLNQTRTVQFPLDWNNKAYTALWLYNLHYFDDLMADGATERRQWHQALVTQWIADNPVGAGAGWDSYPTSLRIVNWTKWYLSGHVTLPGFLESLAMQSSWLSKRVEYHLQANHLWANAKALLFAEVLFEGEEAKRWRGKGERLLREQLDVQILSDGGHFERSPMYHAIVLEDVLDLLQLAAVFPSVISEELLGKCRAAAERMLLWLAALTHPDAALAFFNDSARGIAADLPALQSYAEAVGITCTDKISAGLTELKSSGYVRAQNPAMVLLCDVGELGPDFQPGHGHADTLSFEASLFGTRLFVNCGIDRYESGEERVFQRSTAAHSTVEIDAENSSEVWGSFRVARRARPFAYEAQQSDGSVSIACSHDGYCRLPGKVVHHRHWELQEHSLTITDTLTGKFNTAVARFFLHPDVEVISSTGNTCSLRHSGRNVRIETSDGDLEIAESKYHPEFGVSLPNKCLLVRFTLSHCTARIYWNEANNTARVAQ